MCPQTHHGNDPGTQATGGSICYTAIVRVWGKTIGAELIRRYIGTFETISK